MSRRRLATLAVIVAAAVAWSLPSPGLVLGHGDEEEALAEAPARTLAQQALGLLTQADEPAEAGERLEAALSSEDSEGVDLDSVRDALRALERDDHEEAIAHLNEALAPEDEPAKPAEERAEQPADEHEEAGGAASEQPLPPEEALSHAEEFEPARATEEWVGLALGVALIVIAFGLLVTSRRVTAH